MFTENFSYNPQAIKELLPNRKDAANNIESKKNEESGKTTSPD